MAIDQENILETVAKEVPRFFNDTVNQFRDGEGQYLSTGEPESAISKIGQAVGRAACRQFAQSPGAVDGEPATRFERACRPYLERIGQGEAGRIGPPFRGGQCAVNYDVSLPIGSYSFRRTICSSGVVEFEGSAVSRGIANVPGPIQRVEVKSSINGNCGPIDLLFVVTGADGVERPAGTIATTTATRKLEMKDFRPILTRSDGLPDTCGNPVDPTGNPIPGPNPFPNPFRFSDGDKVDVDISVGVNPDGSITFNIGGGDITIDPFVNEDDGGGGGGGGGGDRAPGDQGEPGTPQDVAPGDAAEGEDPLRSLAGVLVQTIDTPPRANRLLNPTESYTKGAYFVYLGGDAGLELIDTAAITRPDQYYSAPAGCNRFRVVPNAGFTIRVTPYYLEE